MCSNASRSCPPVTPGNASSSPAAGACTATDTSTSGPGTHGGGEACAAANAMRLIAVRWPVGPATDTSAVASRHPGTAGLVATTLPSSTTRVPSRRSTSSHRWLIPVSSAGTSRTAVVGVPAGTTTCTDVAPALVATRSRTASDGNASPLTSDTGPGTRSSTSSPSPPGASVSTTNRPSSSASRSTNGVRERNVAGAAAQLLLSTNRRPSSSCPGVARAQLPRDANRHRVGSGASGWSNRSSRA